MPRSPAPASATTLYFGITCVGIGIVMGMDTIVPQALGAGRDDDARRAVGAGVRLAILVGLVATLVVLRVAAAARARRRRSRRAAEARPFVYMRALGVVPFLITVALRSYLAAHGRTRPLVIAVILGNIVNAGLDLVLIYGVGLGCDRLRRARDDDRPDDDDASSTALGVRSIDAA